MGRCSRRRRSSDLGRLAAVGEGASGRVRFAARGRKPAKPRVPSRPLRAQDTFVHRELIVHRLRALRRRSARSSLRKSNTSTRTIAGSSDKRPQSGIKVLIALARSVRPRCTRAGAGRAAALRASSTRWDFKTCELGSSAQPPRGHRRSRRTATASRASRPDRPC